VRFVVLPREVERYAKRLAITIANLSTDPALFALIQRLSARQRAATPIEFRDLLLGMARSVLR